MPTFRKLSEPAWYALEEALSTYHWYKSDFQTLVRARFSEAPDALAAVNFDDTKRAATGQLVRELRLKERKYQTLVIDALIALSEFDPGFPHLTRLEDGPTRVAAAKTAHDAIVSVIAQYSELVVLERGGNTRSRRDAREGDCASASREPTQGPQGPIHDNARFI